MMSELNNIIKELDALGQEEIAKEIKAITDPEILDEKTFFAGRIRVLIAKLENLIDNLQRELRAYDSYSEVKIASLEDWMDDIETAIKPLFP